MLQAARGLRAKTGRNPFGIDGTPRSRQYVSCLLTTQRVDMHCMWRQGSLCVQPPRVDKGES